MAADRVFGSTVNQAGYKTINGCPLPPPPPCSSPQALVAADRVFGSTVNRAGYKTINGCGVIQGDGIDVTVLKRIAGAIEAAGFSAENVAYGMGGGLLQKVSRLWMVKVVLFLNLVSTMESRLLALRVA